MKQCKRAVPLLIALFIVAAAFLLLPIEADAATSGDYTYEVSGGKATITACNTSISGDITIPSQLDGYPVTGIGNSAFSYCSSLTTITIPDSVTSIGSSAFSRCSSLTTITIPDSVTSIGIYAFSYCSSLTAITIPEGVSVIGERTFYDCKKLTKAILPKGLTEIGFEAFKLCENLSEFAIPESVTSIGTGAFDNCKSLTQITIPEGVTRIEGCTFRICKSLSVIIIPEGVTSIGERAFLDCSGLFVITIPKSVTSIDFNAFGYCYSLNHVAFTGDQDQWDNITISGGNSYLTGATRHYGNPFREIDNCLENGTYCQVCEKFVRRKRKVDGSHSYDNPCDPICNSCSEERSIEHNYVSSCDTCCNLCGLERTTQSDHYFYVGKYQCALCGFIDALVSGTCGDAVEWALLPNDTLYIYGTGAMEDFTKANQPWKAYRKQIKSIVVDDGVTYIGKYAFYYLKQAESITIPESVTGIAKYAGLSLTGLTEIRYASSSDIWQRIVVSTGNGSLLQEDILNSVDSRYAQLKVTAPSKLHYLQGEELDLSGMKVTLVDAEGNEYAVSDYIVYGYNANSLTTQEITVITSSLYATFAVNVRAEGTCGAEGDNIKWTVTDGVLELSGTGRMADYTTKTSPFRTDYMNDIKTVKVGEGITYIGKYAFYYLIKVGTARLPLSLQEIGKAAFYKTKTVINKYFAGTEYQWSMVTVGKNNTTLDAAKLRCESTATIVSLELTQLPDKLTYTVGEALDTTGLIAIGHYNDGSTKDLTAKVKFSGFSSKKPGTRTVTVKYGAGLASTTFQVEIIEAAE